MKRKPKCKILDAFGWPRGDFTGYVICQADEAARPVAFVDTSWGMGDAEALIVAEAIAANPARLEEPMDEVYDLRFTGIDEPMPPIVYTLAVGPHGKGEEHSAPFRPFCPFLFRELSDARDRFEGRERISIDPSSFRRAAALPDATPTPHVLIGRVPICGRDYAVFLVHGRLFLDGLERDVICHHDEGKIEISDRLDKLGVSRAIASAVAESRTQQMKSGASVSQASPETPGSNRGEQAEGPSAA